MTHKPVTLSIFFPAYNEEENIIPSIEKAIDVAESSPFVEKFEVIVVNDGSSDHTKSRVKHYIDSLHASRSTSPAVSSTKLADVRLVNHPQNRGYGAAVLSGIHAAQMNYVFFTDADLQFDLTELNSLLVQIPNAEVILGYRAPRRDPFMRLLNAAGWKGLNRLLFGLKVRDIDCAFKLFPTSLVQRFRYVATGAMTSAEILIRLTRSGASIKEVPVTHWPRVAGSPTGAKLSVIARAFTEMIQLYVGELGLATQKQAIRFICVGVLNTLVDIIAYIALTRVPELAVSITMAKLISFLAGTVTSFVLNRSWTFQMRSKVRFIEVVRFYSVISLSLIINIVVMSFLTNYLGVYDLVALLLTTVFTFAASFTLSRAWVFIKEVPRPSIPAELSPKFPQST